MSSPLNGFLDPSNDFFELTGQLSSSTTEHSLTIHVAITGVFDDFDDDGVPDFRDNCPARAQRWSDEQQRFCIRRRVRHRTDPLDGPSRRLVRARRDDDSRDTVRRSWDCPCGGGRRLYPDHRRALLHIRLSAPLRGANRPDSPRRVCARSLRSAEPLLDRRRPSVHLCSVGEPPRRLSGTSRAHGVPRRLVLEGVL